MLPFFSYHQIRRPIHPHSAIQPREQSLPLLSLTTPGARWAQGGLHSWAAARRGTRSSCWLWRRRSRGRRRWCAGGGERRGVAGAGRSALGRVWWTKTNKKRVERLRRKPPPLTPTHISSFVPPPATGTQHTRPRARASRIARVTVPRPLTRGAPTGRPSGQPGQPFFGASSPFFYGGTQNTARPRLSRRRVPLSAPSTRACWTSPSQRCRDAGPSGVGRQI